MRTALANSAWVDEQPWLIGAMTPDELRTYLERAERMQARLIARHIHLSSWLVEQRAIAEEERWRRTHPRS